VRDVLQQLRGWSGAGVPVAVATVVATSKSAPRPPGATMAVGGDGTVAGSVSGGCVEGAVVEVARRVLDGSPPELAHFGYSDDDAFAVGLTCGGEIDVFVRPLAVPAWDAVGSALEAGRPVAVATVLQAPDGGPVRAGTSVTVWPEGVDGSLGTEGLDVAVTADTRGFLEQGRTGARRYGAHGERRVDDVTVFVESFAPPPRMLVFGAIDFAAAVARVGSLLGYHVTVCDARPVFATRARFPEADEVVVEWPHRFLARTEVDSRTVLCVLTHDPKFDVPLLEVALGTDAAYIGVMGSRRTHEDRLALLRARGVTAESLARLRSPIGLDLGARTPEETAVSVAAEIIAGHWGGSGRPLSETEGAIHQPVPSALAAGG